MRPVKIYDNMGLKLLAGTDDNNGNALQFEFDEFAKQAFPATYFTDSDD